MKKNNPSHRPEIVEKIKNTKKERGNLNTWKGERGGNGKYTEPQLLLAELLNLSMEYPISTARIKEQFPSLPNCYKVDLAHLESLTAIEIDGEGHNSKESKLLDKKKTEALNALGWSVLRFSNKDVMKNTKTVVKTVQQFIVLK